MWCGCGVVVVMWYTCSAGMAVVGAGAVVCYGECYLERCVVVVLWYFRVLFECWLSVVFRVGAVSVVVCRVFW